MARMFELGVAKHTETEKDFYVYLIGGKFVLRLQADINVDRYTKGKGVPRKHYMHYKGNKYGYIGTVYDGAYKYAYYVDSKGNHWLRPYDMFFDNTEYEGKEVKRFTEI